MLALILAIVLAAALSLWFSTLTYSLRDFSRARLEEYLDRRGKLDYLEPTIEHANELIFATAVWRMLANLAILMCLLSLFQRLLRQPLAEYGSAAAVTAVLTLLVSVAIPTALAKHAASTIVGAFVGPVHLLRWLMTPVTRLMAVIDRIVGAAAAGAVEPEPEQIEKELLSVVEEGEKEGVMDEDERQMIQSVMEFRNTLVRQIMTARPDIIGLPLGASLEQVKRVIEESGHSRIPVYDGTLDQIAGILYARDLLKHLGCPAEPFDIRSAMRPAFYAPETKPLRDLLSDFRAQKVHMAIVLDEYGGIVGLVTIEDLLEELVGEISDEHEPHEPALLKTLSSNVSEADARIHVDVLNRNLHLNLPDDAGYNTLGGFLSTALGRIPPIGTVYEHNGVRYTILDAEPQRVNRVRIESLTPDPQTEPEEAREATSRRQ